MKMGKFWKPQQGTLARKIVKDVTPAPGAATKKTWIWKVEMRASLVLPEEYVIHASGSMEGFLPARNL